MKAFLVTVVQLGLRPIRFHAIGMNSTAVGMAAARRFDGVCGVSVKPAKATQ